MKAGAERAEPSEAREAPHPGRKYKCKHEHKYELHNESGAERAKRSEAREARPPLTRT